MCGIEMTIPDQRKRFEAWNKILYSLRTKEKVGEALGAVGWLMMHHTAIRLQCDEDLQDAAREAYLEGVSDGRI